MASSKKNKTPQDQAIAAKRVEFVKANPNLDPAEARKRFFVQTRAAELQAKGVEVTKQKRQELRQKFASGGVQRQGFYTPGDLQRIAAAKANTGSTGGSSAGGPTGGSSTAGSGQNFSEYKMLSKENTARRPTAPKTTNKNGFDEQSFNPMQFFKSPLARGVAGVAKGAYNIAESTAESFNATFINPTVNLAGRAIGKNPNLRQAGALEAAINTADFALTVATLGAAKGVTAVPIAAAKKSLIKTAAEKTALKIDDVMPGMNVSGKLASIGKNTVKVADATKTTTASKVGAKLKASTPVKSSTPKLGVKTAGSADQVPSFLKGVDEVPSFLKPTAAAKAKPKATPKPRASAAPKNAAGKPYTKMKDIDIDLKVGNPAEQAAAKNAKAVIETPAPKAKPKAAPKPKATPKSKPAAAKPAAAKPAAAKPAAAKPKASKEINRFADAWDDSPIDMSKVDFSEFGMESSKPYSTARRATKKTDDVAPAPAPKPAAKKAAPKKSAPKTTAPKANAKAAFDKSVAPIKAGSQTKLTFKTQADYNQFLKTGGKERLRQMSPDVRASFERVNEKWMKGATEARQAAEEAQKNNAARALARKGRYDRARPALKAKFNEALIKKQERELLAKVTKKK